MTLARPKPTSLQGRPTAPRSTGRLALAWWTAFLIATVAGLHAAGEALAPPPLNPGQLGDWLGRRQPAEAAFAVLRLVALGLAWYLLLATVAAVLARASGWRSLVRVLDAVTVPAVRRMVAGCVGVSLAAAVLTGPGGEALAEEQREASSTAEVGETMRRLPDTPTPAIGETMRRLPDAPTPVTGPTAPASAPRSTAAGGEGLGGARPVMRRLPPVATDPAPEPAPGGAPAPAGRAWTVEPGDHFWAVAERVLAEAWGRAPTDDEVDPYWRALVEANAAVLRDPGNPDLLFQGQVIAVPVPPARPGG